MGFQEKAKAAAERAATKGMAAAEQAATKGKAAAEQAATKTKEEVEDAQTRRALAHAYEDLGRAAFGLIESGEIAHERLTAPADEVRKLRAQVLASV